MVFCPECGTQNEDSAAFCGNCGYNLQKDTVQQPPQGHQQPPQGHQQPPQGYQQPPQGYQQPPQGYQQPPQGHQQPPRGYQQPPQGYPSGISPTMGQYMMTRKSKAGPMILSCFCSGLGMLMVDSNKYGAKAVGVFIGSIILSYILGPLFIILWILGLVWTSQAVDEFNRELAAQFGVQPY